MKKVYKRWQEKALKEAMGVRRVLLLSGPRQSGKTTLCHKITSNDIIYRTLDNPTLLAAAQNDPQGFIKHDKHMMVIDEVQRVPNLLLSIKEAVDQDNRPGQYLLTGSSNIQSLSSVRESLAGRIRHLRLRGLTQGEIENKEPLFLEQIFSKTYKVQQLSCNQQEIINRAMRGGFPEVIPMGDQDRRLWHLDYVKSLIERDLKDIANIKRQDAMRSLITTLAAWSSKFMDIAAIGSALAIQRHTIESYINALETLYLVERVPPWTKTDYGRIGKRDKLFMTDCGLMASILGWRRQAIPFDVDRLGKLFETFVFNELQAQIDCTNNTYRLFQYRDKDKREIDFILEREDGALVGIEVKSGSAVDNKSFKHLRWFQNHLCEGRPFYGVVLYTGEHIIPFGENFWALPISLLWC